MPSSEHSKIRSKILQQTTFIEPVTPKFFELNVKDESVAIYEQYVSRVKVQKQ